VLVGGRGQQVDMIGHQHVAMDSYAMRARCVAQAVEIEPVICGACEHRSAVIAALNDVQRSPRVVEAGKARHAASVHFWDAACHHPKVVSDPVCPKIVSDPIFARYFPKIVRHPA
jgi:hypothetical protein